MLKRVFHNGEWMWQDCGGANSKGVGDYRKNTLRSKAILSRTIRIVTNFSPKRADGYIKAIKKGRGIPIDKPPTA